MDSNTKNRPNVMFIMADQLRYSAIDDEKVLTPNFDKLRQEACFMDNFYSNTPVCVPSRSCIVTGRYPHSTGIRENHSLLEANREIHLFRAMKQAGYELAYSGKNHVLQDEEFANFEFASVAENYELKGKQKEFKEFERECANRVKSYGYKCACYHELGVESTMAHIFTDEMIRFLRGRSGDRPFCGFLSTIEPHYPHVVPKEIWDMYEGVEFDIPNVWEHDISEKASRYRVKQQAQHADEATYEEKQRYLRAYYSFVTLYDMQVGRMIDELKRLDLWDNTLVMVSTDHGEFAFNHCMYKKDLVLIEDLLHIPMFVSLPKALRGEGGKQGVGSRPGESSKQGASSKPFESDKLIESDEPVEAYSARPIDGIAEQVDILPTILDVCGVDVPFGVQGRSMLPMLTGGATGEYVPKTAAYAEIDPPWLRNPFANVREHEEYWHNRGADPQFNIPGDFSKCIHDDKYWYVWYGNGEEELYDRLEDHGCSQNLLGETAQNSDKAAEYQQIARDMKLRLLEWNALSENPLDPVMVARLQEQYDCWIDHSAGNQGGWLPNWVEMYTPFRNKY